MHRKDKRRPGSAKHRLLGQTDTVLAAIDDLLTATGCQLDRDQGPSIRA